MVHLKMMVLDTCHISRDFARTYLVVLLLDIDMILKCSPRSLSWII